MNATLDRSEEMQGSTAAMSGKRVVLKYEGTLWSGAGKFLSGQSLSATVSGRTPLVAVMETADLRNRHDSSEFGDRTARDSGESLESERYVLER